MGCVCTHEDKNIEYKTEFYQKNYEAEQTIIKNQKLLRILIRLQGIIKGRIFRKRLKKQLNNNE